MKLLILLSIMALVSNHEMLLEFKSERISKTASFTVHGKIENVFPLFGPIREKEWADGWNPEIIYRSHQDILVEEHMIFQTDGNEEEGKYTWVITQFQPEKHLVEYTVSTHERIWFIRVNCQAVGEHTRVHVSYTYTSFTEEGNKKNEQALNRMYAHDLKDWEEAINYYLKTGKLLTPH